MFCSKSGESESGEYLSGQPGKSNESDDLGGTIPSLKLTKPMKTPLFPCKYHQKGGFSMAMLVLGRVTHTIHVWYIISRRKEVGATSWCFGASLVVLRVAMVHLERGCGGGTTGSWTRWGAGMGANLCSHPEGIHDSWMMP